MKAQKLFATVIVLLSCLAVNASDLQEGVPSHEIPKEIDGVGVTEHKGDQLPLHLTFTNEQGEVLPLGAYFSTGKPVLMAMVYYNCPSLCSYQLNGLTEVIKNMKTKLGDEFEFVAVSMDPKETHDLAAKKKDNYIKALGQVGAGKYWHFLVGSDYNVKALADALGFKYKWNEASQQYAHAAASYILTPDGHISRYLYGIDFSSETLRLSLVEAGRGKIGTIIDQIVLFCFQFDPAKNKYTLYAFNLMRAAAALTVLVLAVFLIPIWKKERLRQAHRA